MIPPVGEGAATPPCTSSADAGRDRRPTHQQPISFSTPVLSVNVGSLSGTSYSLDLDKQTLETAPTNAKVRVEVWMVRGATGRTCRLEK